MTTDLFHPARMPYRDAHGFAAHPDLALFTDGQDAYDDAALARQGFAIARVTLQAQNAPLASLYRDGDERAAARWEPTPPGEGWTLAAVYDDAHGPVAYFVRPWRG